MSNRKVMLIVGKSAAGKTTSLRNLKDPNGVVYLCCESGKDLPFATNDEGKPAKFREQIITHPDQVPTIIKKAGANPKIHTVIIDSLTYLMGMYETKIIAHAENTMAAWGDYYKYFVNMMQTEVADSKLNIIFLAHTTDLLNESEHVMETRVKVKGSLMANGIESWFNHVIGCKRLTLSKLKGQESPGLNITEDDKLLDYKYVYQTRLTKDTINETLRGPLGLWKASETFIDNDLQYVIDKLNTYYK